jgi:hypothetical protein
VGWMCSWIAVKDASKNELLAALDLIETGQQVQAGLGLAPMCCAARPDGWVVLFSKDFYWADREQVLDLSRFGLTVGCQFEDKVEMASSACAAQGGVELWRVSHVNDPTYRLDVSGDPPAELSEIRDRLFREQDEDGGEESSVDFIHAIPWIWPNPSEATAPTRICPCSSD